jgi:hypothetical protein
MALNALSRPNELGAPSRPAPYSPMPRQVGPWGVTMIRASGRAPDRTAPSLARFCAIGIVGLWGRRGV